MASKDILKRSQALLSGFLVMFLFFFSSCDKLLDLLEGGDDEEDVTIEFPNSQTSWEVSNEGDLIRVEFSASNDWEIIVDESALSWISVSPLNGTAGEYTLEISVSANDTEEERNGFVAIVSGDMRKDINIFQHRQEIVLDIPDSQTSWDISSGEKVIEVNLVTNKDWSVEIDGSASSWISVSPSQGTAGEYTLKISVSENNTENQRNGILTVVCGDERRDIYINQKEKTFQPEGEGPEDMPIEEWK